MVDPTRVVMLCESVEDIEVIEVVGSVDIVLHMIKSARISGEF